MGKDFFIAIWNAYSPFTPAVFYKKYPIVYKNILVNSILINENWNKSEQLYST